MLVLSVLCLALCIIIIHPVNFIHWGYLKVCVCPFVCPHCADNSVLMLVPTPRSNTPPLNVLLYNEQRRGNVRKGKERRGEER